MVRYQLMNAVNMKKNVVVKFDSWNKDSKLISFIGKDIGLFPQLILANRRANIANQLKLIYFMVMSQ